MGGIEMVSTALETKNVYENFELETDILFFKIGAHGLVSFHGRNYNIRKRMSTEQLSTLTAHTGYFQIKSDCYVNVSKISSIEDDQLFFGQKSGDAKVIPISRRKQQLIRELMRG